MTLDEQELDDARLPLVDDGRRHRVRVEIAAGAEAPAGARPEGIDILEHAWPDRVRPGELRC